MTNVARRSNSGVPTQERRLLFHFVSSTIVQLICSCAGFLMNSRRNKKLYSYVDGFGSKVSNRNFHDYFQASLDSL